MWLRDDYWTNDPHNCWTISAIFSYVRLIRTHGHGFVEDTWNFSGVHMRQIAEIVLQVWGSFKWVQTSQVFNKVSKQWDIYWRLRKRLKCPLFLVREGPKNSRGKLEMLVSVWEREIASNWVRLTLNAWDLRALWILLPEITLYLRNIPNTVVFGINIPI